MNKKLLSKTTVIILLLTFVLTTLTVFANDGIAPINIAIVRTSNALELGSFGKLTCFGSTEVQIGYTSKVKVELQDYDDDGWATIKTWTDTGTFGAAVQEDYYVGHGKYRLKLTHYAYDEDDNSLVESFIKYSNIEYYN